MFVCSVFWQNHRTRFEKEVLDTMARQRAILKPAQSQH
jgi:hypothetical protein